jgi:hypothetical protein
MTEQGKGWEMPDPEHDMYGEPKYSSFSRKWMKVPVQFGKMSAVERQVIFLGAIGSIPRLGKRESYYRIGRGQKGAGRFFVERRRKDEEGRLWIQTYYITLGAMPEEIRDAVKKNEGEYHDWGTA